MGFFGTWQGLTTLAAINLTVMIVGFNWVSVIGFLWCTVFAIIRYKEDTRNV